MEMEELLRSSPFSAEFLAAFGEQLRENDRARAEGRELEPYKRPLSKEGGRMRIYKTDHDEDIQELLNDLSLLRVDRCRRGLEIAELRADVDRLMTKVVDGIYLPYFTKGSPHCLADRLDELRSQLNGMGRVMDEKISPAARLSMQKTSSKKREKAVNNQAEQAARSADIEEKHEEWLAGLWDSVARSPGLLCQMENMTVRETDGFSPAMSSCGEEEEEDEEEDEEVTLLADDVQMKDGPTGSVQGSSGQDGEEEDVKNDKDHKRSKAKKAGKMKVGKGGRRR